MQTYDQLIKDAETRALNNEPIQAMQLYAEAAKLAPAEKTPLIKLAVLFRQEGDVDGAAGFLEKALTLDPNDVFVRLNLGLAYYEQHRLGDAIPHLKEAVLIIQDFVAATRIDALFLSGAEIEARLNQANELEETANQAVELLQQIAATLAEGDEAAVEETEADVHLVS